jgi:hypothetical protein
MIITLDIHSKTFPKVCIKHLEDFYKKSISCTRAPDMCSYKIMFETDITTLNLNFNAQFFRFYNIEIWDPQNELKNIFINNKFIAIIYENTFERIWVNNKDTSTQCIIKIGNWGNPYKPWTTSLLKDHLGKKYITFSNH